jgi:AraC family transcriptional regulator, regulatory protein of adaptative response / DNA-3-methyladenine glycosylase II
VAAADGDTYRRTITVAGAPGLIEVSPAPDGLLLRAHLPYWEGLIHLVGRVGRLLGLETDNSAAVAALSADPVLGPLVTARPGLAVPLAWSPLEVAIEAAGDPERQAGLVSTLGIPVPGLPGGLTHALPWSPPPVQPPAARPAPADHDYAADGPAPAGPGSAAGLPPVELAAVGLAPADPEYQAFRLGERQAFPLTDPALRAALASRGLTGPRPQWQPWLSLAAAHLMAS